MKPYITVIMPSLNVVNYIDECIQSVLNQTLQNIEILCVDAGSTDGTYEKLEEYAKNDARVHLISSEKKSYGYQVNIGIKMAQGEYVGIVETDDFIESDMYEFLYKIACNTHADYIKADYDEFSEDCDGNREYKTIGLFREMSWFKDKIPYDKVICPQKMIYLYTHDYYVWKGIYNRKFLIENEVLFNESRGAAYQDIGFTQLLHACAKTAYYTDKSFYRYRLDRNESSSNTGRGLFYAYNEFNRLMKVQELNKKLVCEEGLYWHMVISFNGEYAKALRAANYNIYSPELEECVTWFKKYIQDIIDCKEFWNEYNEPIRNHVTELLKKGYEQKLKTWDENNRKREELIAYIKGKDVIIFGCGIRGEGMVKLLKEKKRNIVALTDNSKNLWGNEKYGIKVFSPLDCTNKFSDAVFVIANKNNSEEMKKQLEDMGISSERIVIS